MHYKIYKTMPSISLPRGQTGFHGNVHVRGAFPTYLRKMCTHTTRTTASAQTTLHFDGVDNFSRRANKTNAGWLAHTVGKNEERHTYTHSQSAFLSQCTSTFYMGRSAEKGGSDRGVWVQGIMRGTRVYTKWFPYFTGAQCVLVHNSRYVHADNPAAAAVYVQYIL